MIVEILAHAAAHHQPGLEFVGLDTLRIFKGVRLDHNAELRLRGMADKAIRRGQEFRVSTRLVSGDAGEEKLHAQAEIVLSSVRPTVDAGEKPTSLVGDHPVPSDPYEALLFHGAHFQGLRQIESISDEGIVVLSETAEPPASWCGESWRSAWLADPLAIDVALQTLIVWTQTVCGVPSLPTAIEAYRQFRPRFPADGVRIALDVRRRNSATVVADVDFRDLRGDPVARLTGLEHVLDAQLREAFRQNRLP
jgi:hypothetical protein